MLNSEKNLFQSLQITEEEFTQHVGCTLPELLDKIKALSYFLGEHTDGDGRNLDDFPAHFFTLRRLDRLLSEIPIR